MLYVCSEHGDLFNGRLKGGGGGGILLFFADKKAISIPLEIDRVFQIMSIVHQE